MAKTAKKSRGKPASFPNQKTQTFAAAIPASTLKRFRSRVKKAGMRFNRAINDALEAYMSQVV